MKGCQQNYELFYILRGTRNLSFFNYYTLGWNPVRIDLNPPVVFYWPSEGDSAVANLFITGKKLPRF